MNQYPIKCRISNEGASTRVDVYDDIGGGGLFSNGVSASDFAGAIAGVRGSLDVHINSGGGIVWDGIAIMNAIKGHRGPVTTVVDGLAASIASVIAQAGAQRVMQPGSMLMIHDAFAPFEGNAAEMGKMAQTLDQVSDNLAGIYASRAGGTPAGWRDRMRAETWFTAEEAVQAGLADRVAGDGAAIPAGYDLAAYHVPSRIAASLRTLPVVAAGSAEQHDWQIIQIPLTRDLLRSMIREEMRAAAASPSFMHGDHQRLDPDGDGDCDACAAGDTDGDYWDADGKQIQALPGQDAMNTAAPVLNADKYNTDDRKRMASAGTALPDGSYPIADEEDLHNAIHAVGRGNAPHDTIRRHIIKRAKALGLSSAIPEEWNGDGSNSSAGDSLAAQFLALVRQTPARAGKE